MEWSGGGVISRENRVPGTLAASSSQVEDGFERLA